MATEAPHPHTPLSPFAEQKISELAASYAARRFFASLGGGILVLWAFLAWQAWRQHTALSLESFGFLALLFATGLIPFSFAFIPHKGVTFFNAKKRYTQAYAENLLDYQLSRRIQAIFDDFAKFSPIDFEPAEAPIPGRWRPFDFAYHVSAAVRGHIWPDQETIWGVTLPDLLDQSAVITAVNETDETLRMIIPSVTVAREMIAETIRKFFPKRGTSIWKTHVEIALEHWKTSETRHIAPLAEPRLVDYLKYMAQEVPIGQRPLLTVTGTIAHEGVVIASSIAHNGLRYHVLPSGFCRALEGELQKVVSNTAGTLLPAA